MIKLLIISLLFSLTACGQSVKVNGLGTPVHINGTGPAISINGFRLGPLERHLIYVCGQSNAGAYHHLTSDNSELVSRGFDGFKDSIFVLSSNHLLYNLNLPSVNTAVPYSTSARDYWGMEQHTLHGAREKFGKSVYLARRHGGGASITEFLTGGSLRATWISYLNAAIDSMENRGYTPVITIIWVQGEEDSGTEAGYTNYESRLRTLISEAKAIQTPYTTNLRWVSIKLNSTSYSGTGGQAINAVFDAVIDIPNVYRWNPGTVVPTWSGSHYTKEGLMTASEGLWNYLQSLGLF